MSNKKTIKAVPDDQKTKPKSETELGLAEGAVKKVKTTDISDFRRALVIGRENIDKYNEHGGEYELTFKVMGNNGVESRHHIKYCAKLLNAGDWRKYGDMQLVKYQRKDGKGEANISDLSSAVIIGCLEADGSRIFSPKDAEMLDHSANAIAILEAAGIILTASGASGDQDAVEKPD